jgi:hypothetical protein
MLEGIYGNASAEKVLLLLEQYEEGPATAIARCFDDLDRAGARVSTLEGRTRPCSWNPRHAIRWPDEADLERVAQDVILIETAVRASVDVATEKA